MKTENIALVLGWARSQAQPNTMMFDRVRDAIDEIEAIRSVQETCKEDQKAIMETPKAEILENYCGICGSKFDFGENYCWKCGKPRRLR